MDITDRLKGEQKLQQDDYGRGLQVLDDAVEHIDELRDENDRLRLKVVEEEVEKLRAVYEAARRFLRFNGVDRAKAGEAVDQLDAAVEEVRLWESLADR